MCPKSPLSSVFLSPFSPTTLMWRFLPYTWIEIPLISGSLSSLPLNKCCLLPKRSSGGNIVSIFLLVYMWMDHKNALRVYGSQWLCIWVRDPVRKGLQPTQSGLCEQGNLWAHEILKSKSILISGKVWYRGSIESSGHLYITQLCSLSKVGLQYALRLQSWKVDQIMFICAWCLVHCLPHNEDPINICQIQLFV